MNSSAAAACSALVLVVLHLARPSGAEQPWCKIDDPSAYRAALKAASGGRDPTCPSPADPQTLPDELVLPMPCDERLVLRKVVVSGETLLDQQTAHLGEPVDEEGNLTSVTNGPHTTVLAGAFLGGWDQRDRHRPIDPRKLNGRTYYLGKYEVTEPQYRAIGLLDGNNGDQPSVAACNAFRNEITSLRDIQVHPAVGVSWFDAVAFARSYSTWLLARDRAAIAAGHAPALPWEQGSPSYLRLPTEAEWEFAARAGAVGSDDQSINTYRVRDPDTGKIRIAELSEVAQISEVADADQNSIAGVGRKLPNLLGFYDMIGNADEIVFDLFRLIRPESLHGQAGGYLVKGGNAFTSTKVLGVAHRREVPFFELSGETHAKTTGFRVALSLPVFVYGAAADQSWTTGRQNPVYFSALADARVRLVKSIEPTDTDAAASLGELRQEIARGQLDLEQTRTKLASIAADLDRSNAQLNDATRQARRERIKAATLLAYDIRATGANLLIERAFFRDLSSRVHQPGLRAAERSQLQTQLDRISQRMAERDQSLTTTFGVYVEMATEIAKDNQGEREDAAKAVHEQFQTQGLNLFNKYEQLLLDHAQQLAKRGGSLSSAVKRAWLYQIDDTRPLRERQAAQ
jgi:formylglycine-generating enzyme required for sulfatase activity